MFFAKIVLISFRFISILALFMVVSLTLASVIDFNASEDLLYIGSYSMFGLVFACNIFFLNRWLLVLEYFAALIFFEIAQWFLFLLEKHKIEDDESFDFKRVADLLEDFMSTGQLSSYLEVELMSITSVFILLSLFYLSRSYFESRMASASSFFGLEASAKRALEVSGQQRPSFFEGTVRVVASGIMVAGVLLFLVYGALLNREPESKDPEIRALIKTLNKMPSDSDRRKNDDDDLIPLH